MELEIGNKQKWFLTKSMINRNKHFYDIESINRLESIHEVNRRRPSNRYDLSEDKFNMTFMNATTVVGFKLEKEIGKFKGRLSCERQKQCESTQDEGSTYGERIAFVSRTHSMPRKIKGVIPMDRCIPRNDPISKKGQQLYDERLYNNFKLKQPDLQHTPDLSLKLGRKKGIIPASRDLHYDLSNYENLRYDTSEFRCLIDYKNQKFQKERIYSHKVRDQDIPKTQLNPEKIEEALRKTQPIHIKAVNPFFNETGKQIPSQLHMRTMKTGENYWMVDGRYAHPKLDFSLRRLKDIAWEKRMNTKKPHKAPINRQQVCMDYYFRRQK